MGTLGYCRGKSVEPPNGGDSLVAAYARVPSGESPLRSSLIITHRVTQGSQWSPWATARTPLTGLNKGPSPDSRPQTGSDCQPQNGGYHKAGLPPCRERRGLWAKLRATPWAVPSWSFMPPSGERTAPGSLGLGSGASGRAVTGHRSGFSRSERLWMGRRVGAQERRGPTGLTSRSSPRRSRRACGARRGRPRRGR